MSSPKKLDKVGLTNTLHNLGVLRSLEKIPIKGLECLGKDKVGREMYTFSVHPHLFHFALLACLHVKTSTSA